MALIENGNVLVSRGELLLLLGSEQGTFLAWYNGADPLAVVTRQAGEFAQVSMIDLESPMMRNPADDPALPGLIPYLLAGGVITQATVDAIGAFIAAEKAKAAVDPAEALPTDNGKAHRWRIPLPAGEGIGWVTQWFPVESVFASMDSGDLIVEADADACAAPGAIKEV